MTFQPPPPPPPPAPPPGPAGQPHGAPPPPPLGAQPAGAQPPGAWGPPPGSPYRASRPAFDPKTVNPLDWAILGVGALVFIFSFFGYISVDAGPYSDSIGAWHFSDWTFLTWFGMAFAVIGAALVALELFAPQVRLPWPNRLVGFGLFGVAFVLYFIAIFVHPTFIDTPLGGIGHGFSFWLSLVLVLGGAVLSLMRLQQTGTALPGALSSLPNIGGYAPGAPGGAHHPGAPQNQPPGYPPPPGPPAP